MQASVTNLTGLLRSQAHEYDKTIMMPPVSKQMESLEDLYDLFNSQTAPYFATGLVWVKDAGVVRYYYFGNELEVGKNKDSVKNTLLVEYHKFPVSGLDEFKEQFIDTFGVCPDWLVISKNLISGIKEKLRVFKAVRAFDAKGNSKFHIIHTRQTVSRNYDGYVNDSIPADGAEAIRALVTYTKGHFLSKYWQVPAGRIAAKLNALKNTDLKDDILEDLIISVITLRQRVPSIANNDATGIRNFFDEVEQLLEHFV